MSAKAEGVFGSKQALLIQVFMLLCVLSTFAVFGLRLDSVVQLHGMLPTSGQEGSGSMGVFQVCTGAPLYDNLKFEPNVYVFNFLFYESYGWLSHLWGPCEISVPLVGRLLSCAFSLLIFALIVTIRDTRTPALESIAIATAALSPFVGWWAFSLRPDVGASVMFLLSILSMLAYIERPRPLSIIFAAVFLCASWGFKQTFIFAWPIYFIYSFRGSRTHAAVFLGATTACLLLPAALYGIESYLFHTVEVEAGHALSFHIALQNTELFISKAFPSILLFVVVLVSVRRNELRPGHRFLLTMILFSAGVTLIAAGKGGASENYFFPTFFLLLVFVVKTLPRCSDERRATALLTYSAASLLLVGFVASGYRGKLALDNDLNEVLSAAEKINSLPGPKLVWDEVLALPWFTKGVATRITWSGDANGKTGAFDPKQKVRAQYYQSIVIPSYYQDQFDLRGYSEEGSVDNLFIYRRRPAE